MAIGKPLLVNQRRDIERPVMSAQTQQLSSNVPVQKLAMLDYSIGQANTKASFAVTDELRGLVDAGVQAKLYMDNTKREYERLNLMEDWQKSNMDFQGRFAHARTPEAQATVIADYENDTQNRIGTYTKSQGNGAKQLSQLADLRNTANTQFSKFSVTHQNNLFKQTAGMLATDTATIAQSVAEDANVDPVSAFKKIADNYGEMVAIGALDAPTAQYQQRQLQDKMITGRSTLFAQNYAKEATATGQYPTDAEFSNRMEGVMGLKLSDRRLKLLKESFTDSYFKEMGETNREIAAQETFALRITEEGRLQLKEEVNQAIIDGAVGPVETERLIKKAHTFDKAKPGFGLAVEKQLRDAKHGTAYQPYVAHFTTGQGRDVIMETIKASGTSYFDLAELRSHLETMGGKYQGMNESTIQGILKHWRGINDSTSKGLLDQGPDVMQTTLMTMIKKGSEKPEWLSDETMTKLQAPGMLSAMANPMQLNWSKTMQYSKAHSRAWNITLADLAAEKKNEQGVFSPKNLSQPADTQRAMLENYVEKLLEKNFSQSVNEELSKMENIRIQKAEKIESAKQQKAEKAKKDALTFSMESIGDGESTTPTAPTVDKTPPALKLIEKQVAKKRIRNAQYSNTFRDQLQKGDVSGAMGTAIASKYVDVTQAFRDAHEQSKLTYGKSPMNEYNAHLGEMAEVSKNINKELSSGIWEKLSKAVGQGEPITLDGLANDMGLLVGTLGNRLIDGMENHAIEKTPITDIKRKQETTPDPMPTPLGKVASIISNVLSPSAAEAVTSISRDSSQGLYDQPSGEYRLQPGKYGPDSWNPGERYLDANGEFTDVMPLDVRDRVLSEPEAFPDFTTYNLVQGDNLGRVAQAAGITLEELQNLNSNTVGNETRLQIGDPILLPKDSNAMPSVASPMQDSGQQSVGVPDPMAFDNALMDINPPATTPLTDNKREVLVYGDTTGNGSAKQTGKFRIKEIPGFEAVTQYQETVIEDEGYATTPYVDTRDEQGRAKKWSAGVGHQLTPSELRQWKGRIIDADTIAEWFQADLAKATRSATKEVDNFPLIPADKKSNFVEALTKVHFQGGPGFFKKKFEQAYNALVDGDWQKASENIEYSKTTIPRDQWVKSKWWKQTQNRAEDFQSAVDALATPADTSPASNTAMAQNAFVLTPEEQAFYQQKLEVIQELLMKERQGRTAEEQRDLEAHLKELEIFKLNLGGQKQELRTGEIQDKDPKNYKLNMNPVYTGKDPSRNKRNI